MSKEENKAEKYKVKDPKSKLKYAYWREDEGCV